MDREELIQIHGKPVNPPDTITKTATDADGNLYTLEYTLENISQTGTEE